MKKAIKTFAFLVVMIVIGFVLSSAFKHRQVQSQEPSQETEQSVVNNQLRVKGLQGSFK